MKRLTIFLPSGFELAYTTEDYNKLRPTLRKYWKPARDIVIDESDGVVVIHPDKSRTLYAHLPFQLEVKDG